MVGATAPVTWGTCPSATLAGVPADQVKFYSCARYRVPIDHDNASLGTIDIALLKRAARTPDARVGSLFLNPGGPAVRACGCRSAASSTSSRRCSTAST